MLDRIKQFFVKGSSINEQPDSNKSRALENQAHANKRRHARHDVEIQGILSSAGQEYPVEMLDLSKSGAKLMANNVNAMPETGQSVTLTLSWPLETDRDDLSVDASVVRVENSQISVQFAHVEGNGN